MSVEKRLERFLGAGIILSINPPDLLPKIPITIKKSNPDGYERYVVECGAIRHEYFALSSAIEKANVLVELYYFTNV